MPISSELPISKIKVHIPHRRRELITRTRLINAIYDQLEKRLLLIIAPAGYGKTSLLVDLAQQSELPVSWLSLDSLDQDPQRFLRYLIAAIAGQFASFGRDSLAALESMASIEQDEERLLITISNEISSQIHEHFILILDDYHLVSDAISINHAISRFLQLADEHVHLILSTRNLPDLPDVPLMIARNQMGSLRLEELSFCPEEIQQLFLQNNGRLLSLEDAQTLVKETEGWIAAIHLTNGNPGKLPQMHPLESTRELFDFFTKEILLRQPEQVRRFMLMTSIFETFDVSLCEQVLGPLVEGNCFEWSSLFETVRTGNLFSIPLDKEGYWMRYHHIFQHYLQSQLQSEQPVLARYIQQNLARVYEDRQDWESAMDVYARLGDYESLAQLLSRRGKIFTMAGRILTLATWLDKLPSNIVSSHPVLVSLLGVIHSTRGDCRQALGLYDLAEAKLRGTGSEVEWTTVLVRRAEACRQLGYYERAQQDIEQVLKLTKNSSTGEMLDIFSEALRLKGLVFLALGHTKEALICLQEALHVRQSFGLNHLVPILEKDLGVVHRRLGEPEIAAQYYASALRALENAGNTGWKASLLNNIGLLYHMTGRLEEACSRLQEALLVAERSGYTEIQAIVLISLADLLTDLTDFDSAYTYYDKALTLAPDWDHSLYNNFYVSLGQARLQRLKGNHLLAGEGLRRIELSLSNLGIFERAIFDLELGCCYLDGNQLELALDILHESVALFDQVGNPMERSAAQLWLEVALSIRDPEGATSRLKDLLPARRDWQIPTLQMIHAGRAVHWLKKRKSPQLKDPVLKAFFQQAECIRKSLPALCRNLRDGNDNVQLALPPSAEAVETISDKKARTRIVIADNHPLIRAGLQSSLTSEPDLCIVGEAANGEEAQRLCRDQRPDVLLLDLRIPGSSALEVLAYLHQHSPQTRVLMLTAFDDKARVRGLVEMGVAGYMLKEEAPDMLPEAIRAVMRGFAWVSQSAARKLTEPPASATLTQREQEVLRLLARGGTNRKIAEELCIAEITVRFHLRNIYNKIDVGNRAQAVRWAMQHGLWE